MSATPLNPPRRRDVHPLLKTAYDRAKADWRRGLNPFDVLAAIHDLGVFLTRRADCAHLIATLLEERCTGVTDEAEGVRDG